MTYPQKTLDELKRLFLERSLIGGAGSQVVVTNTEAASVPVNVVDRAARLLGVISLDAATLAALETISVANFPATQQVSGSVDLNAASLSALESISINGLTLGSSGNIYNSDTISLKVGQGKFRLAGAKQTTNATNQNAYALISNPAANTKNIFVVHFNVQGISSTETSFFSSETDQATYGTSQLLFNPNRSVEAAVAGTVRVGTTLPVGAVMQSSTRLSPANSGFEFNGLSIIPPGKAMGVVVAGSATGTTIFTNIRFYEE